MAKYRLIYFHKKHLIQSQQELSCCTDTETAAQPHCRNADTVIKIFKNCSDLRAIMDSKITTSDWMDWSCSYILVPSATRDPVPFKTSIKGWQLQHSTDGKQFGSEEGLAAVTLTHNTNVTLLGRAFKLPVIFEKDMFWLKRKICSGLHKGSY